MTIGDKEFFESMKELSDTISRKYDQKLDTINMLLQTILQELNNKDMNCLKNQTLCKESLHKIFLNKEDLPREVEKLFHKIEDERLKNISKFRKLVFDVVDLIKLFVIVVFGIVTIFGIDKFLKMKG